MTTIRSRSALDIGAALDVATDHLAELRDAITVLYDTVGNLPPSVRLTILGSTQTINGVIHADVQAELLDRLLDLHDHAEAGIAGAMQALRGY